LITGGAGFIGSNLAARLLGEGWEVIVFDNLSRKGSKKNLLWLKESYKTQKLYIETKDVRDFAAIKEVVGKTEVIFHLASQVAVTASVENPREDFEINALGSFNVLEAARASGHKPIVIYASSNKVYGSMDTAGVKMGAKRYLLTDFKDGIDEHYPLDFHSPYGCSKGAADQYTRDYFRIYGIPTVVFRQSCIYGPRQMGVEDQGWVAHFAISSILGRQVTIYGDGKQVRDLLYIDDLIDAYLKAVEKISKVRGEVFNIGGGSKNSLSILEYLEYLEKKLKKSIKIRFVRKWRSGDQKVFISNNSKLGKMVGWTPKVAALSGIDRLVDWIEVNKRIFL